MSPQGIAWSRLSVILRAALLLLGVSTYLISRDDVVWHFIKASPHARVLEHVFFGLATALLGLALLLKVISSAHQEDPESRDRSRITAIVANFLQAIGIGSLLPLPGFLLLTLGDLAISLLLDSRQPIAEGPAIEPLHGSRWAGALARHIGLCLAFFSMAVFSIVLIDRVADVLFAITALISIAAKLNVGRWSGLTTRAP